MKKISRLGLLLGFLAMSFGLGPAPVPANPGQGPGTLEEWGRFLLDDRGCVGCHPIAGTEWKKNGPPLDRMAAKVDPSWLVAWIKDPRGFEAHGRMPFFGLDEDQSRAVAAYLLHSSSPEELDAFTPSQGDPQQGERLVSEIGCLGCHSLESDPEGSMEPSRRSLIGIGAKTDPAWLLAWVKDPSRLHPGTAMPNFRLSDSDTSDIASYLSGLEGNDPIEKANLPEVADLEDLASEGKDLIEEKGCFGCHVIPGFGEMERIGSEIEDWTPEDFTLMHQSGEETDLLVPQFFLAETEIEAIAAAANGEQTLEGKEAALVAGRSLVRHYQCTACHRVERLGDNEYWGGDVQAWIENPGYDPPPLFGEGSKVQSKWMKDYLSNVSAIRPWIKVRMPSFSFAPDEVDTLVAYFKTLEGLPVEEDVVGPSDVSQVHLQAGTLIFAGFQCIKCHPVNAEMSAAVSDLSTLAPDLSLATDRLRYPWLHLWLLDPQSVAPGTRMPDYFPEQGSQKNLSIAYQMVNAKQNAHLKKEFLGLMTEEEMKRSLEDSDWVIDRLGEFLWNFKADDYLARFPWTPASESSSEGPR